MAASEEDRAILPVPRPKADARRLYDRISRLYGYLTRFERKYAATALDRLAVQKGETALEIGFGSGHCLRRIAESAGDIGKAYGVDLSAGMLEVTKRRLNKAGLAGRVELSRGDAANLPYRDGVFNAVFLSFTLDLFDTPEIPRVLQEIKRVLKPGGRVGVVSISREDDRSASLRVYEWIHQRWPRYVDCRPIYVERSLRDTGYRIVSKEKASLFGLPVEIVVALTAK